jgi:hypothetical protein
LLVAWLIAPPAPRRASVMVDGLIVTALVLLLPLLKAWSC